MTQNTVIVDEWDIVLIEEPAKPAVDAEYESWKRANGLDKPLSREAYVVLFDPNGLNEI
jgi:hypothetical protein